MYSSTSIELQVQRLHFECQAVDSVSIGANKGSALRGAIYNCLRCSFCRYPAMHSCKDCSLHGACSLCDLFSPVNEDGRRGHDSPRPYVLRPPLDQKPGYAPGELFSFGITLIGSAVRLAPYLTLGVQSAGVAGIGAGRGRFALRAVHTEEPAVGVGVQSVGRAAELRGQGYGGTRTSAQDILRVRFVTPTRLVARGELVRRIDFATLLRRLLDRLSALCRAYGTKDASIQDWDLLRAAEDVAVLDDRTFWVEQRRFSTRHDRFLPAGGLMGEIEYQGNWPRFAEYLAWGEIVHVGKYAVLGNGWLEMLPKVA